VGADRARVAAAEPDRAPSAVAAEDTQVIPLQRHGDEFRPHPVPGFDDPVPATPPVGRDGAAETTQVIAAGDFRPEPATTSLPGGTRPTRDAADEDETQDVSDGPPPGRSDEDETQDVVSGPAPVHSDGNGSRDVSDGPVPAPDGGDGTRETSGDGSGTRDVSDDPVPASDGGDENRETSGGGVAAPAARSDEGERTQMIPARRPGDT
jgi:hypothetical protein